MAPSRRQSNGRSPLVNQQRQITSFFSKSSSSSPSPSPILPKQKSSNPNSKNADPSSPSPSPTTPSPSNTKRKKPLLVIGASSPSTPPPSSVFVGNQSYGQDHVGRRIKVYWPLDKAWYEGCVKSFDKATGKHLVQYDDGEEETLDLAKEKIEWVQETFSKLKRLRRGFSTLEQVVVEDDEGAENVMEETPGADIAEDNSSDEDWEKNGVVKDADDSEDDMELVEEEDQEDVTEGSKGKASVKVECKKRKLGGGQKSISAKKSKSRGEIDKGSLKVSMLESASNLESE